MPYYLLIGQVLSNIIVSLYLHLMKKVRNMFNIFSFIIFVHSSDFDDGDYDCYDDGCNSYSYCGLLTNNHSTTYNHHYFYCLQSYLQSIEARHCCLFGINSYFLHFLPLRPILKRHALQYSSFQ